MKLNTLFLFTILVVFSGCMTNQYFYETNYNTEIIKETTFYVDEKVVDFEENSEEEYYYKEVTIDDEETLNWLLSLENRDFTQEDAIKFESFLAKHQENEVVSMAIAVANEDVEEQRNEVKISRRGAVSNQKEQGFVLGTQSGGISLADFSYSGNTVWYSNNDRYSLGLSPQGNFLRGEFTSLSLRIRINF